MSVEPRHSDALIEAGRRLFTAPWDFKWAANSLSDLPPMEGMEIALAGRSNVGKSSLINALTGRNALARTSNTPGRTQQLNFFRASDQFSLVDMPGYGYAAVGKDKVSTWTRLIHDYLRGRVNLARVYVLIDARHGIKDTDTPILDILDKAAVSYQIILTKSDAIKASDQPKLIEKVRSSIAKRAAAHPDMYLTSSETGFGIAELRASIAALLAERA
jgi:GTP-binding protein